MNWPVFWLAFVCGYALSLIIATCGREIYYFMKRRVMRLRCLTGRHDHKMGVAARDGRSGGCLWCRQSVQQTSGRKRNEIDTLLTRSSAKETTDAM